MLDDKEYEGLTEEEKALQKVRDFRKRSEDDDTDFRKRMERGDRFRAGGEKQWDPDVLRYNKSKKKFSLSINRILPITNDICGTEIDNRKTIEARPRRDGSHTVANIITALAKHAFEESHAQAEKSHQFEDGITTGAGYLAVDIDKLIDDPQNPELEVGKLVPFDVWRDPSVQVYDWNKEDGAKFVSYDKWELKSKVEAEFPDKKTKLEAASYRRDSESIFKGLLSNLFRRNTKDEYRDSKEGTLASVLERYKYRVTRTLWKEWVEGALLYDLQEPLSPRTLTDPKDITNAKKAIKGLAGEEPRYKLVEKPVEVLHYAKSVGDVLLKHVEDPLQGITMFTVVPFHPYFQNGYAFGVVENLIGSQEEENWAHSMALNLIKKLANTGWIVDRLPAGMKDWFKRHSSEDGVVIDRSKVGNVEKIKPNELTNHLFFAEKAAQNIQEQANVRLEKPEFDKRQMSGKAIELKQWSAQKGNLVMLGNFDWSFQIFSTLIIELIRNRRLNLYSDEEIREIVSKAELVDNDLIQQAAEILSGQGIELPPPPVDIEQYLQMAQIDPTLMQRVSQDVQTELETYQEAQQQYDRIVRQLAEELLFEELRNLQKGRYSIKVDSSPQAPTRRMLNAAMLEEFDARRPGIIPAKRIILASDLPDKDEIAEEVEQREQAMLQQGAQR